MNHEFLPMFIIMFIAGLLSTMNLYVNNFNDIRFSINDIYMSLVMCGWMFLLYGIFYNIIHYIIGGIIFLLIIFYCIRNQFLISSNQYVKAMIPHHSMAVKMSKELLKNEKINDELSELANNIIKSQEDEINQMKKMEKDFFNDANS